jgi:homopolymeric O-antigen transport system ATP-binding protein
MGFAMLSDVSIKLNGVGKTYEMYTHPAMRLLQTLSLKRYKFYRELKVLNNISIEIKRGECFGIIGHNGCGKSTLLQLIGGIIKTTQGTIETNGNISLLLDLGCGFVLDFTGRENIFLSAAILGFSRQQTVEMFDDIVEFAELQNFIDIQIKKYSAGMLMRLAFAIQIMVSPDILIIDEVLAVGDAKFQEKGFARIAKLREQGVTIVIASHDISAVQRFCNRAILLKNGNMICEGKPEVVCESYYKSIKQEL